MSSLEFGLTEKQVVHEIATKLHSGILNILGYGIYTGVYFVALYLTLSRAERRSAVLISVMWILVTIHASITWACLDNIYIQHGETRETELTIILNRSFHGQLVADAVVTFISLVLADMTMIWRCWVLYGRRWLMIIIPGASLVTGSVCYVWLSILIWAPNGVWKTDKMSNLELTFLSTTVLTNVFCTTTIVYRPLRVDGWRKLPKARTYRRIMETLIESSILYTAIYVIRIGLQIHTQYFTKEVDERARFAKALGYSITGIAPTLIIACLAAAQPHPSDSLARTRFDRSATTHTTVVDVDLERSRFHEDFDGPADGHSLPVVSLSQTVSSEKESERGQVPFKDDHV